MTEDQITIVKTTWAAVQEIAETAASLFYARLFELDPALRPMFSNSDMAEQGRKLMTMIGIAVKGLDKLEALVPAVESLGRRHVGYGVQAHHYDTVGAALLDTLGKGLGDAFTPEAKEAWSLTYGTLAGVMKNASYEGAAVRPPLRPQDTAAQQSASSLPSLQST
jgi:hemoglobin-like flavoprotein